MGVTLNRVTSAKYLGIIIDDKLSWVHHIQSLKNKLLKLGGMISKLWYYIDMSTLIKVYYALVYSQLQYGIVVWGTAAKSFLNSLRTIQNKT